MQRAPNDLLARIAEAFRSGRYTLKLHGFERMLELNNPQELRQVVLNGEVIEYDPPGIRGPDASVLYSGMSSKDQPQHVKVAEHVTASGFRHFVITAYEPSHDIWEDDFRQRRQAR